MRKRRVKWIKPYKGRSLKAHCVGYILKPLRTQGARSTIQYKKEKEMKVRTQGARSTIPYQKEKEKKERIPLLTTMTSETIEIISNKSKLCWHKKCWFLIKGHINCILIKQCRRSSGRPINIFQNLWNREIKEILTITFINKDLKKKN